MSGWLWLTIGYGVLAVVMLLFFAGVAKGNREHDAMIEREERRIREDVRAMRAWYNSSLVNVEGENEAEIAAVFLDMAARG